MKDFKLQTETRNADYKIDKSEIKKKKLGSLGLSLLIFMSGLLGACGGTVSSGTVTTRTTILKVGDYFEGNFSAYKVLGIDDSNATLNVFAVGEDEEAIYMYYKISGTHEKSVVLTTVQDELNPGPISGEYDWGLGEVARHYGEAGNAFEIKFSMNDSSLFNGTDMISNMEGLNIQLMYTNGENNIYYGGNVDTSLGDVYGSGNVIEIKVFKFALSQVGMPVLSDAESLKFAAGAWHTIDWTNNAPDGAHGYFPAENKGPVIAYMLPYSDPTSAIYTGGVMTGVVSTYPTALQGAEDDLLSTNVTVTLVDPDSTSTSVNLTVESSAESGTTTLSLSGTDGVFQADLGLVSAVGDVTESAINFDPTSGVESIISIIFTDVSTGEVTTNSFTVQPD